MMFKHPLAHAAGMLLLLGSYLLPASWSPDSVRYFALGYMGLGFVLHAIAGYRRRRPFWKADSWRRYLLASAIPVGSLAIMFTMTALADAGHPLAGARGSAARMIWIGATVTFLLVGACGFVLVLQSLHDGDASEPFSAGMWLRRGRHPQS